MKDLLKQIGFKVLEDKNAEHIPLWRAWYSGYRKEVHDYSVYNGKKKVKCTRSKLKMAKKVCENWADLLLNEKVAITVGNNTQNDMVDKVLKANNFRQRANQLIELSFALGTGALVEFKGGENINIDFITADKIYPISCENGEITECAFGSVKIIDSKKYYYINIHKKENGRYVVLNYLFDDNKKQCPLPEGVLDKVYTKSTTPFYQIIKPNITSNTDIDAVMGISVFANSEDVLNAIDVVFDSYRNEFILGKKRIIVPMTMAQYTDDSGEIRPAFDANDIAFYGYAQDDENNTLKEIDMKLRADEHDKALNQNLNLLSVKSGLGAGFYKFTSGDIKTATEIITEKSDLFRNLKKHELPLEHALVNMVRAILTLSGQNADTEVQIDFDDSIIEDRKSEFQERSQLTTMGIMSKLEFRMWYFNETEEQAKKALKLIEEDIIPGE